MSTLRPLLWDTAYLLSFALARRVALACRVRVVGDLPRGAVLIASKHASAWDIPLVGGFTRRKLGQRPHFQMGSFVGYRIFGPLVPLFRALGGFSVMRPKEVRRLKSQGLNREEALAEMQRVNAAAEAMRQSLLRSDQSFVVFPEGTRDGEQLLPFVSLLEVESALAVAASGHPVSILPISLAFGRKRLFRRPVELTFGPAFLLKADDTAPDVLAQAQAAIAEHWRAPDEVSSGGS